MSQMTKYINCTIYPTAQESEEQGPSGQTTNPASYFCLCSELLLPTPSFSSPLTHPPFSFSNFCSTFTMFVGERRQKDKHDAEARAVSNEASCCWGHKLRDGPFAQCSWHLDKTLQNGYCHPLFQIKE